MSGVQNPYISPTHVHSIASAQTALALTGSASSETVIKSLPVPASCAVGCNSDHPGGGAPVTVGVAGTTFSSSAFVVSTPTVTGAPL